MVTTSPLVTGLFAAGDCRVIVSCGCVLFCAGCSFSETPLACAQASAVDFGCPTKSGSGGPALTVIVTGRGCGHEAPAGGLVLITMPAAIVADAWSTTVPGISPACFSACCAAASACPLTWGTAMSRGPADGMSRIVVPRRTLLPAPGTVAITSPLATLLSSRGGAVLTVKP